MKMKYLLLYPLVSLFFGSCITYSNNEVVRLELPSIQPGEKVVNYVGYTDIVYGQSPEKVTNMEKIAYSVSYDEWHKIPKWVAYSLSREELGGYARRKGKQFHQDPKAPFRQADRFDYRGSGWTNGHLAPAADFSWSDKAMDDTFYYTNICPQDETLNGGSWQRLENRFRDWAQRFGEIYIVTGPIVGKAENGTIGTNNVTVPDAFFKAVLARDGDSYQTVAFIMENSAATQPYPQCCLTVNDLESIIGIDLFCAIDDAIEESVEGKVNIRFWGM
jgi:endonuclease G